MSLPTTNVQIVAKSLIKKEQSMSVRIPNASTPRNRVEMGSSSKEQTDDIDEAGFNDYKELSYKLFQHRDYKIRGTNGEFICPFCAREEDNDHDYTHLLQHSIRVAEGSLSRKQRAKHFAMARYLAFDLAKEVKAEAATAGLCDVCDSWSNSRKRSKPCGDSSKCPRCNRGPPTPTRKQRVSVSMRKLALAEEREKEALDKVRRLESQLEEMNVELNALIAKDRSSNDELQGVRKELIEGLSEIQPDRRAKGEIGIKKFGELDPDDFITELHERFSPGEIVLKGVELCTLWQERIKDPHWYPYRIVEDATGIPKRLVRDDDVSLCALKEEWGRGIHDAVVEALTDLQENNPSGCYMVPELWNFAEGRKAALGEVIRHIFRLGVGKAKPKPRSKPQNLKG